MTTSTAVVLLGILGALLLALAGLLMMGRRRSPEEKERARLLYLSTRGRMTDAEVTNVDGSIIWYSYEVAGVTYQVTQDVSLFKDLLPGDPSLLLGPVCVRFLPGSPANSILISEQWSGVRIIRPAPLQKQKGV